MRSRSGFGTEVPPSSLTVQTDWRDACSSRGTLSGVVRAARRGRVGAVLSLQLLVRLEKGFHHRLRQSLGRSWVLLQSRSDQEACNQ